MPIAIGQLLSVMAVIRFVDLNIIQGEQLAMATQSPPLSFLPQKDAPETVPPQGGDDWFGIAVDKDGVQIVPLESYANHRAVKLIVPPSERGTVFYRMGFAVKNEGGDEVGIAKCPKPHPPTPTQNRPTPRIQPTSPPNQPRPPPA